MKEKKHFMSKPCSECPFRKNCTPGWLGAERVAGILDSENFTCHKTEDLQCAGHILVSPDRNMANREWLAFTGKPLPVRGRDLVFESGEAMKEHHDFENYPGSAAEWEEWSGLERTVENVEQFIKTKTDGK